MRQGKATKQLNNKNVLWLLEILIGTTNYWFHGAPQVTDSLFQQQRSYCREHALQMQKYEE